MIIYTTYQEFSDYWKEHYKEDKKVYPNKTEKNYLNELKRTYLIDFLNSEGADDKPDYYKLGELCLYEKNENGIFENIKNTKGENKVLNFIENHEAVRKSLLFISFEYSEIMKVINKSQYDIKAIEHLNGEGEFVKIGENNNYFKLNQLRCLKAFIEKKDPDLVGDNITNGFRLNFIHAKNFRIELQKIIDHIDNYVKDFPLKKLKHTINQPDADVKTDDKYKTNLWFKIGLLFANGEMDNLLKRNNNNATQIAEELGNTSYRPYISDSIGVNKKSDKNIFNSRDKMSKIIKHCEDNHIEVKQTFTDLLPME